MNVLYLAKRRNIVRRTPNDLRFRRKRNRLHMRGRHLSFRSCALIMGNAAVAITGSIPMSENASELGLVKQAIAGERVALERLLVMHARRLSRHLQPKIPDVLKGVIDVDDILQQTFLQVFRDIRTFEPGGQGSFYAWLRGIADNRLFDCIREHKRKKRGGDFRRQVAGGNQGSVAADILDLLSAGKTTPSVSIARREMIDALQVGIACLPDDQRRAIQLHCLEGRSLDETAQMMEKTPGAIRALVHRGKCKLQEQLDRSALWLSQGR